MKIYRIVRRILDNLAIPAVGGLALYVYDKAPLVGTWLTGVEVGMILTGVYWTVTGAIDEITKTREQGSTVVEFKRHG